MKNIVRYAFMLLALGYGVVANAQVTLTLGKVHETSTTNWEYSMVECTGTTSIRTILISMINNDVILAPTTHAKDTYTSSGYNPRTVLYVFHTPITTAQAATFIAGIDFRREVPNRVDATPYANITVDANPTDLPDVPTTTKITVWDGHPDGSLHYYVWVPASTDDTKAYKYAYEHAKRCYFQGMRGYLATITSQAEDAKLTNISGLEGWSGGARTPDDIADGETIPGTGRVPTMTPANNYGNSTDVYDGRYYRWLCGPETGFQYYYHAPNNFPNVNGDGHPDRSHVMNNAYTAWNGTVGQIDQEPNNNHGDFGENIMQVNYGLQRRWNDYSPTNTDIQGYFIEFGGNGQAYNVTWNGETAHYPVNENYYEPTSTTPTTNDQWVGFSPGNKATTVTTFKPNLMYSNALVIDAAE